MDLFKGVRVRNSPTRYARRRQGDKEIQPPAHDCLPCMRSIGPCRRRCTFQDDSPRRLAHGAGWAGFHIPGLQEGQESTLLALNRSTCRGRSTKGTRRSKSVPVILFRWRPDVTGDLTSRESNSRISRLLSGTQVLRNRSQKSGPLVHCSRKKVPVVCNSVSQDSPRLALPVAPRQCRAFRRTQNFAGDSPHVLPLVFFFLVIFFFQTLKRCQWGSPISSPPK
jgi:hypothetical protein